MATKQRQDLAEKLSLSLGNIPISYDNGSGIWWNRVNAMKLCGEDCDFVCVLQDDAIPCKDFFKEVENLVKEEKAYSLYFGNRRNMQELGKSGEIAGYVQTDWLSWGVGIILPTKIIKDLIAYWEKRTDYLRNDDTRISKYLRTIKMPVYYPIPSLVDHRHEVKSLMDNSEGVKMRKAYKFKG